MSQPAPNGRPVAARKGKQGAKMRGLVPVEVKSERFENCGWGVVCCCCGQRIPRGAAMSAEIRDDANQAKTAWLYTRHYLRCPSATRPHDFNVDLAHAIIKLTDNFGTFQLDKVVTSASGRRACSNTLPEIVRICTESLLLLSGPDDTHNHNHNHRRRLIGSTSQTRITAATNDPVSFLEDHATEARRSGGGESQAEVELRIKRAVCKATVDALFLLSSPAADPLLTTVCGFLVALPGTRAATEAVPSPWSFPRRRISAAASAASEGATVGHRLAVRAAGLLDTRPTSNTP